MTKFKYLTPVVFAAAVFSSSAFAQQAGSVTSLSGNVVVIRGADTYTLGEGDLLFDGDRILTRPGGSVTINTPGCNVAMTGGNSIVVDSQICVKTPIQLTQADEILLENAGGTGGGLAAGGGVGAAAGLTGAALVAAVAAATTGDGEPASP